MKVTNVRKGLVLVSMASALVLGCELIVDFDRTLIPVEDAGTVVPDTGVPETGADVEQPDAAPDADPDADAALPDGDADLPDGDADTDGG